MAKKTKFVTSNTIVTADVLNKIFGGLRGSAEGSQLSSTDPLVAGIIHDGKNLDGHAQKISLTDHVTDLLDGDNILDASIAKEKLEGIEVLDDGYSEGDFITFDFAGSGVFVDDAGDGQITITIPGASSDLAVQEEGSGIGTFSTLNFVGGDVTATDAGGGVAQIEIGSTTVDLQEAYDNGNEIIIDNPSGTPVLITNNNQSGNGLIIEHVGNSGPSIAGLNVFATEIDGIAGIFQNRVTSLHQASFVDARTTGGSTGGSTAGYFARDLAAANTDQAVVYIDQVSASDDQPALRLDQAASGVAALEVNGTSTFNDDINVEGDALPQTAGTHDIGSSSLYWKDAYLEATLHFDGVGQISPQQSLFIRTGANNDVILLEDSTEWARFDSSIDTLNFTNSSTVNSDGSSITVQVSGDGGVVYLNSGGGSDVIIQENGTEWARFDSSADALNFVNSGTISSDDDLTLSVSNTDILAFECGFLNIDCINGIDIDAAGTDVGRIAANSLYFGLDADVGIDIYFDALNNQDIIFQENGVTVAAFDKSISSKPFVLGGSDSTSGIAAVGAKLHVEDVQAGSASLVAVVNESPLAGVSTGNILQLEFSNRANPQSAQTFISFRDSGGEVGDISGDGIGGVTYSPFTGAHKGIVESTHNFRQGMIMVSTGEVTDNFSVKVDISAVEKDPRVMGVYVSEDDENSSKAIYNAIGDGYILVSNANGEVSNGDLIETSQLPGYGQKQDDDIFRNSTVAKCTQDIDWNNIDELYNGYKIALVSCTYHCG